jgi:ribose-phosphate pyrophosphokinase
MFKILKINPTGIQKELDFKDFNFPAGEVSVKLNAKDYAYRAIDLPHTIVANIQSSDDLFKLAMLKDALTRFDPRPVRLFIPYFPYARQDRVCDRGEAFSLTVVAKFIAAQGFAHVTIVDPHSNATPAALEGAGIPLTVITQLDILNGFTNFIPVLMGSLLVSPDAGSNKKVSDAAEWLIHPNFIRADKLRDLTNGTIKEIVVYADDLKGRQVVILDDICERGGTFVGLAKVLKAKNAGKVILFVTHGVFGGKGEAQATIEKLLASGIDEIWTTNSYYGDLCAELNCNDALKVLKLEERFFDRI